MKKRLCLATLLSLVVVGCAGSGADGVLQDALAAMGDVNSIQYSGTGMSPFFGQALDAGKEWPPRELSKFTRTISYQQRAMREELSFAQPQFGGQEQNMQVNNEFAWTVGPAGPVPQLTTTEERQLHIWLTPHGFVKGAMASGTATMSQTEGGSVVSFTTDNSGYFSRFPWSGPFKIDGTIDAQNLVTRVETKVPNSVLGDTDLVATYSDYKDSWPGVKFPTKILVVQGGFPVLDLTVTSVVPDATVNLPVPPSVQGSKIEPAQTTSTKLADGVWHVMGGSHHSVVVEFSEYLAVIEAPQHEERSLAVIAEAKKLAPNKPIRYVLTTHHHFDHIGGLRTYVPEGATVVTHQSNVPYFEKTLMAPATIYPDRQARNPQTPRFHPVSDKSVITDGKQTIEVYATGGDNHTNEYTLFYLPGPRILVEGDLYSPGPPDAPPPSPPPSPAVTLYDAIQSLKLNVATIVPIHGRGAVPIGELRKFIGKG